MTTWVCADTTRTEVASKIASAASGDTVTVPSGTSAWASSISVSNAITITGAGEGSTTITGAGFSYNPTTTEASKTFDLSGFTFSTGTNLFDASSPSGSVAITGLKVHNCTFTAASSVGVLLTGLEFGVFYSCTFTNCYRPIFVWNSEQNGFDYWTNNSDYQGGPHYPYFEDCTFSWTADQGGFIVAELGRGGRIVVRNSTISNTATQAVYYEVHDCHGINGDWGDGGRGTVSAEFYKNSYTMPTVAIGDRWLNQRGGRMIFANNTNNRAMSIELTEYYSWNNANGYEVKPPWWVSGPWAPYVVNNSYYWNNSSTNPATSHAEDATYIREGQEYWPDIGTLATGKQFTSGLESALPATCAVGDTYASTDTTKIWRCNSTNVWTVLYTPYTYPHPLRSDGAVSAPIGWLRA